METKTNLFQDSQICRRDIPDGVVKFRDTKFFRCNFEIRTNFFPDKKISGFPRQCCQILICSKTWIGTKPHLIWTLMMILLNRSRHPKVTWCNALGTITLLYFGQCSIVLSFVALFLALDTLPLPNYAVAFVLCHFFCFSCLTCHILHDTPYMTNWYLFFDPCTLLFYMPCPWRKIIIKAVAFHTFPFVSFVMYLSICLFCEATHTFYLSLSLCSCPFFLAISQTLLLLFVHLLTF